MFLNVLCRYHKSQAIYLESKENTKISCVISSVGANEVRERLPISVKALNVNRYLLTDSSGSVRRSSLARFPVNCCPPLWFYIAACFLPQFWGWTPVLKVDPVSSAGSCLHGNSWLVGEGRLTAEYLRAVGFHLDPLLVTKAKLH